MIESLVFSKYFRALTATLSAAKPWKAFSSLPELSLSRSGRRIYNLLPLIKLGEPQQVVLLLKN